MCGGGCKVTPRRHLPAVNTSTFPTFFLSEKLTSFCSSLRLNRHGEVIRFAKKERRKWKKTEAWIYVLHVREKFACTNFYFPKREGNDRASCLKIRTLDESRPLLCVFDPMHASGNPDGVTLITNLAKKRAPHSLTMHSQTRIKRAFPPCSIWPCITHCSAHTCRKARGNRGGGRAVWGGGLPERHKGINHSLGQKLRGGSTYTFPKKNFRNAIFVPF